MVIPESLFSFFAFTTFPRQRPTHRCQTPDPSLSVFLFLHVTTCFPRRPSALALKGHININLHNLTRMRGELARCCSPAKCVIELIAAVRAGSYNTFTCSIRSCSHEPAVEWLAPDVRQWKQSRRIQQGRWGDVFSVTREGWESSLVILKYPKRMSIFTSSGRIGLHLIRQPFFAKSSWVILSYELSMW